MNTKEESKIPFSITSSVFGIYVFVGEKRYDYDTHEKRLDKWIDSLDPVIKSYQDGFNKIPLGKRLDYLYKIVESFLTKMPDLYVADWVDKMIKQVEAELLSLEFINEGKAEEANITDLENQLAEAQKRIAELESEANEFYSGDETTTIITGSRGRENRRRITAKEIGQIVAEYKWEKGLEKNQLVEMLYRITGLKEGSLKDFIRYKDR